MHEYLLRLFPAGDPGHVAIHNRSYLFRKADRDEDILSNHPCIKPFRDVVMRDDFLQTSVIFPYDESYKSVCPKCRTERTAVFGGASLRW